VAKELQKNELKPWLSKPWCIPSKANAEFVWKMEDVLEVYKRLVDRFEFHYTPKHGSWLDMAEIELGILGRQCLARRIDSIQDLHREVAAWETARDAASTKVNWPFTTADAWIKLRKLYPSIEG